MAESRRPTGFDYRLLAECELMIREIQQRIDAILDTIGQPKDEDQWIALGYLATQKYEQMGLASRLANAMRESLSR